PATEITHVISQVTFPAYSKLQDDPTKLKDAYLKVLQLTAFLSFPLAAGIIVLAPDFTQIFLGPKWMSAVPLIQVLALAGLARSLAATSGYLFYALGKTKIDTVLQIIRLIIMLALIYPMSLFMGLMGVAMAVLISILIVNVGFNAMAIKITKCSLRQFIKIIIIPFINGVLTAIIILLLKNYLGPGFIKFIALLLIGTSLYLLISLILEKLLNYEITIIASQIIASLRGT
ncbi:MAG: oligosaccharide flippase family protein, partial [Dehalococcoidia bacterium]